MRDRFEKAGFNFVDEVMTTLANVTDPIPKLDALVKLAPYFMQRLREESEDKDTPPIPGTVNNTQINIGRSANELMTELLAEVLGKKTVSKTV